MGRRVGEQVWPLALYLDGIAFPKKDFVWVYMVYNLATRSPLAFRRIHLFTPLRARLAFAVVHACAWYGVPSARVGTMPPKDDLSLKTLDAT